MTAPVEAGRPGRGPVTVIAPGAASLAVRGPVTGPRQELRLIAADSCAVYLELPAHTPEPRVIVLSAADVPRLPNAVALTSRPDPATPGGLDQIVATAGDGTAEAWVGRGTVQARGLTLRVLRWWDPSPVLGPLSRARLEQGAAALQRACVAARYQPSLAGHDDPAALAACCAEGDLAGAVEAAERMAGLGPGLAPGGDNMISGLLLALRLLGGAIPGGTRAVWLADWLGAAVTSDAELRTTSLGATLLYCAARGQATAEVSAVLLALAGQHPLGPAVRTLLAAGQPAPSSAAPSSAAPSSAAPSSAAPSSAAPAAATPPGATAAAASSAPLSSTALSAAALSDGGGVSPRGTSPRKKAKPAAADHRTARAHTSAAGHSPAAAHAVLAQPAGADLAWGLVAGCRAAVALAQPGR